ENGNGTKRIVIPPKDGNTPDTSVTSRSVVLHDAGGKRLGVDNLDDSAPAGAPPSGAYPPGAQPPAGARPPAGAPGGAPPVGGSHGAHGSHGAGGKSGPSEQPAGIEFNAKVKQEGNNMVVTVDVKGGKPNSTVSAHVHQKAVQGEKPNPKDAGGHYRKGEIDQDDQIQLDENGNGTKRIVKMAMERNALSYLQKMEIPQTLPLQVGRLYYTMQRENV
ncbi:MAG: hypothetical protein P8144_05015, partial [Gammaproteobacteria bacterium]